MARKRKTKPSAQIGTFDEVDNPLYSKDHPASRTNPPRITVAYNAKESPIVWMKHKGYINQAQAMAGSKIRELYEATGFGNIKAFDYSDIFVDGGGMTESISDRRMNAAKKLSEAQDKIGRDGYELVIKVCGQGLWISAIEATEWRQLKAGKELKLCLTELARYWGYESGPITSWRKQSTGLRTSVE